MGLLTGIPLRNHMEINWIAFSMIWMVLNSWSSMRKVYLHINYNNLIKIFRPFRHGLHHDDVPDWSKATPGQTRVQQQNIWRNVSYYHGLEYPLLLHELHCATFPITGDFGQLPPVLAKPLYDVRSYFWKHQNVRHLYNVNSRFWKDQNM